MFTPRSLRESEVQESFNDLAADVGVVVAYGLILPIPVLKAPRLGCINLHASSLPRWRGAAPIHRAVMAGDSQTSIDVMRMDAGLDTGPIGMREIVPIRINETTGELTGRLAAIAARLAVNALASMENGISFREQSTLGVCYARKLEKSEGEIDWSQTAEAICNHIHALSPAPGAFSKVLVGGKEESIKLLRAEIGKRTGIPGMLLSDEMQIACGSGSIRIIHGQRSGKVVMSGRELLRSATLAPGAIFT